MSKVKLTGESSGYVEISAGTAAGNNTLELPTSGVKIVGSDHANNVDNLGVVTATTFSGNVTGNVTGDVTVATGATISGSTNTITASTNGSERVRVDSSGNVGIGTDNPDTGYRVTIKSSTSPHSALLLDTTESDYNTNLYFAKQGTNKWIIGNRATDDSFRFVAGSNERLRITSGGNLQIVNGNLVFSTSGTGIDFSATGEGSGTMTSELLDDYEEGTFTPNLDVSGASGTLSIGYSNQTGRYVKVGRIVHFSIDIRLSSWSRGTGIGGIMVKGLPFVPVNSANYSRATGFCNLYNWDYSADSADIPIWTVYQASNQPWVDINKHREGNTNSDISDPGSTSMIFFSGTYEAGA